MRTRRRARPRPALRQRHGVALRRRGRGSSTARSTATTTGRTRRTATSRRVRHADGPNHVSFALRERQRARRAAGGARAGHRRRSSPGAAPISCSTRPAPTRTARIRTRRSTLDHDDLRERDRCVFAWAKREGLPARLGARGRLHARPPEGRRGASWDLRRGRGRVLLSGCAARRRPPPRCASAPARGSGEDRPSPAGDLDGRRLRLLLPADRDPGPLLVQRVEAQHRLDRLHARVVRGALARLRCWSARSRTA